MRMATEMGGVLFRRVLRGQKQHPDWNTATEFIWASTRCTLLSSSDLGFDWLKNLSDGFKPKARQAKEVHTKMHQDKRGRHMEIRPKSLGKNPHRTLIYFHGGGYVTGTPEASVEFSTRLALQAEARVIVPDYPTAPESRYPAAHRFADEFLADCIDAYPGGELFLAGDSAGAALVLSAMLNLPAADQQLIKGLILISPWTDPLSEAGSVIRHAHTDIGDPEYLFSCYDLYMDGASPDPRYPLSFTSANLKQLPPTLLTVGTAEMLYDQTHDLARALQQHGTQTDLIEYPAMFHTFWNLAPTVPAALEMIAELGEWLRSR